MGEHKYNPTAIKAKNGEIDPKPRPMSAKEKRLAIAAAMDTVMKEKGIPTVNELMGAAKREQEETLRRAFTPRSIEQSADHKMVTVIWTDGSKTVVRRSENDPDDIQTAFSAALAKKIFGSNNKVKKTIDQKLRAHKPREYKLQKTMSAAIRWCESYVAPINAWNVIKSHEVVYQYNELYRSLKIIFNPILRTIAVNYKDVPDPRNAEVIDFEGKFMYRDLTEMKNAVEHMPSANLIRELVVSHDMTGLRKDMSANVYAMHYINED